MQPLTMSPPYIKAAHQAYCLVSTAVTQSHMDVFYDSFGPGGLGAIKPLIHYKEHPAE